MELCFAYPKGRTNKQLGFRVNNRDYSNVLSNYLDQEAVPKDILEVLVNALPLEVRRVLPDFSKKKRK